MAIRLSIDVATRTLDEDDEGVLLGEIRYARGNAVLSGFDAGQDDFLVRVLNGR